MFCSLARDIKRELQAVLEAQLAISAVLEHIERLLSPAKAVTLVFTAYLENQTFEGVTKMDLRDDQKVLLTIEPVDAKGKPAKLDGVPVWAGSDDTVVTIVPASDGLSAVASGVTPGTARVVVTADADLGSGVTPLTGSLDFNITGGQAASLTITAAAPANQ